MRSVLTPPLQASFIETSSPITYTHSNDASAFRQHCPARRQPTRAAAAARSRSSVRVAAGNESEQQPDFIEAMVGKLFGKQALEDPSPFGMPRLSNPEMYPATTTEFADPMEGDDPEVAVVRSLLACTQLETAKLRLAYDANRDGWSCAAFHERVNTFGAGLVVFRTAGGAVAGGYNPRGWIGLGEDRDSIAAFLFSWPSGDVSQRPVKLPKVGGPSLAVIDKPEAGIQFGAEGLRLLVPGREREARSRLGTFYAKLPDGGRSLFASSEDPKSATVVSLQCYVAEGAGEAWQLDGIIWKTQKLQ